MFGPELYRLGSVEACVAADELRDTALEVAREIARSADGGDRLADELGDLLFAVVNVVRLAGFQPGTVLERANRKFERRFRGVESRARAEGHSLPGPDLETLDRYWEQVKRGESPATDDE